MHRWLTRTGFPGPGFVIVLALTLFAILLQLSWAGMPAGSDTRFHIYRTAEMMRSWQHGLFFPAWSEGSYLGYGSPLFHFYASLTYWLASLIGHVAGLDALDALRSLVALCFLACSSGMYLFARRRSGEAGAVLAGLLYVYSPWILYSESFARGVYPGLLSLALFPFLLWRLDALRERPNAVNLASAVLVQAALIHSHNLMALTLTLVALAWVVCDTALQAVISGGKLNWRPGALALAAIVAGAGVTAGFWLPVLLEHDTVHLQNLVALDELDYRRFLVPLHAMLAAPPLHDAGAVNGLRLFRVTGVAQWSLALCGLVTAALRFLRGERSRQLAAVIAVALPAGLMIALIDPASQGVWERLHFMRYLQFPWRLLGPVVACLAILGAANGWWLERAAARLQTVAVALLIATPVVAATPLLFMPARWTLPAVDSTLAAWHAGGELPMSTTFTSEFRPRDVHVFPGATGELLADYADGYPVDKLNHASLAPGSRATLLHNSPQALEWQIDASDDSVAGIFNFYWAGWRVEIDGRPVEIRPSAHHGLITFAMPAGNHHVRVFLGSTPARDLAQGIAALSLLLVAGGALALRRRSPVIPRRRHRTPARIVTGMLSGGALAVILVLLFLREGSAWLRSAPGEALPAQVQRKFTLDGRIQLSGFDLDSEVLRAGEGLKIKLYWYALQEIDIEYTSFVHLSTGGRPQAQLDKPWHEIAVRKWPRDGYVIEVYDLQLPRQLPSGDYQLTAGMYSCELMPPGECGNEQRLAVSDESGAVIGDVIPLATIRIEAAH